MKTFGKIGCALVELVSVLIPCLAIMIVIALTCAALLGKL